MENKICKLLGIKYPIFQGAMTNVSDAKLVTAVSEAGALGIFAPGIEGVDLDWVREQIRTIKKNTTKPFGVNVMLASPYTDAIVDIICEEGVPVVTTGAGSPARFMDKFRAAGIKVIPVVSSVKVALKMEAAGADAIVASGAEGGGYIGRMATLPLIPQVVDAVKIPVIAAGGFADGRGLAAALMLGACGVQMGTRFLTVKECGIPEDVKNAVLNGTSDSSVVIGDRIGVSARARLLNTKDIQGILSYETQEDSTQEGFTGLVTKVRLQKYDLGLDGTLMGCGQTVGMTNDEPTAAELVEKIAAQCKALVPNAF